MALGSLVKTLQNIMRKDAGINGDAQRIEQMTWLFFLKIYDAKEEEWEFHDDSYKSVIPERLRWHSWAVDNCDGKAPTGAELLDFINNDLFKTLADLEMGPNTPLSQVIVKAAFTDANNYMKDGILLRQVVNEIDKAVDFTEYKERHAFGEIYETILKDLQSAGNAGEFYTPRAVTDFMAQALAPKLGEKVADFACGTGGFLTSALKILDSQVNTPADRELYSSSIYGIEKKQLPYLLCVTNMLLHDIDSPEIFHDNSLEHDVRDWKHKKDGQFDVVLMNPPYGGSENASIQNNFPVALRLPQSVFAPYTSITTNVLFFDNTHPSEGVWYYRMDMPDGYKHFSKTKPIKLEHMAKVQEWWSDRKEIEEDGNPKAKFYTVDELRNGGFNLDLCGYPHEEEEILPPDELIRNYKAQREKLDAEIDLKLAQICEILGIEA